MNFPDDGIVDRDDDLQVDLTFTLNVADPIGDIDDMHTKFGVRDVVDTFDADKLKKWLTFRFDFLEEELTEARDALASGEQAQAQNIVDAMIDLMVVAIGTLDGLNVDTDEAWSRVHAANMAKEPGVNPNRPNPLGLPDLIKPEGWTAPDHADNIGSLHRLF